MFRASPASGASIPPHQRKYGETNALIDCIAAPTSRQHHKCSVRAFTASWRGSRVYALQIEVVYVTSMADGSNTVAKFYNNAETFTCISNPSIKLDIARVNDDYCDCPDGSDEPGTSACSYISPLSPPQPSRRGPGSFDETLALPGFYCKNKGHIPSYIPFTNVNDGKCDYDLCCDGSDEHAGVGGVKCPDQCASIGKEWRKKDEARQKSLNNAQQKRGELVAESARLRKEVEDRISTLKAQIEGQTKKVDALTSSLAEIERAEKGRIVKGAGKGGKVTVLAGLAKERIQELSDNVERVRRERDAAKRDAPW
ncbi:hypothetical protein OPT61_g9476 [Boeremia exigua]|uniref:Uncharacterized protein n=1 Tax=Boeremia exigua TaxID=749465 RepID=A0ACC2HUQ0_9PLEO|nr:hypothetical protein OPT61_g9476 [Boeremia exigua]